MAMPQQKPQTSKQDYATPENFIIAVKKKLGIQEFAFDFAADASNAKAGAYWTEQDDSLSKTPREWAGKCGEGWGWLNPPFKTIAPWAQKCELAVRRNGQIALLVPAGVGANWYRDHVHNEAAVYALNGRLAFMPDKPTWLYPKDCILCLFGPDVVPGFDVWNWRVGSESD